MLSYDPNPTSFIGICITIGAISVCTGFFTWPLVDIFISRRFDPQFKHITKNILGLGWFLRGSWYCANMLIPKRAIRNPKGERTIVFGKYDLWTNATKFERTLACLHIFSVYLALIMSLIMAVDHFIFYIRHLTG